MTPDEAEAINEEAIRAYCLTFGTPVGQIVLLDLMKFCRFRAPLGDNIKIDEGKRQVFLRIMEFLTLSPDQLKALVAGRSFTPQESSNG